MATIYPEKENIERLKVKPTSGEWALLRYLDEQLDHTYEVFFNSFLDGDRPDFIILKKNCAAFIVEVKDWDLSHYSVAKDNKWSVNDGIQRSTIASPQSQAFGYKKRLYDLHLPVLGMKWIMNRNFFNVIHPFVYLHGATKPQIEAFYEPARVDLKEERQTLNQKFKDKSLPFAQYDSNNKRLSRWAKNLQRDKGMAFGSDRHADLLSKIRQTEECDLFDEEIYYDFKRRLCPPQHVLGQGIQLSFDRKQLPLTESSEGKQKIRGVAGCGKTSILARRSVNGHQRHASQVLILTYNITLKNYIRDRISDVLGRRDFENFAVTNYHQFFNSQVNELGFDFKDLISRYDLENLYFADIFKGYNETLLRYKSIFIDEVQDYDSTWVKIIRDNFLEKNGEMVLFGDDGQDIYQRHSIRASVIAQGFGTWSVLTRSYRTGLNTGLTRLFKNYQLENLMDRHEEMEKIESDESQLDIEFSLLGYEALPKENWEEDAYHSINNYLREYNLNPNDVVVLSSTIDSIRCLNEYWSQHEQTHCMFETFGELSSHLQTSVEDLKSLPPSKLKEKLKQNDHVVKRIRRTKKNHFYMNSGLIKFSTIHSFKGWECAAVFYLMFDHDDPEIIYTSITRASEHLVVYDVGQANKTSPFFQKHLNQGKHS